MTRSLLEAALAALVACYASASLAGDIEDQAVTACTATARLAAEAVVERDKANGEAYDTVAIGDVDSRKGNLLIVTGSVDVYTDAKMSEFDYACEYNPADPNGASSRIVSIDPR